MGRVASVRGGDDGSVGDYSFGGDAGLPAAPGYLKVWGRVCGVWGSLRSVGVCGGRWLGLWCWQAMVPGCLKVWGEVWYGRRCLSRAGGWGALLQALVPVFFLKVWGKVRIAGGDAEDCDGSSVDRFHRR